MCVCVGKLGTLSLGSTEGGRGVGWALDVGSTSRSAEGGRQLRIHGASAAQMVVGDTTFVRREPLRAPSRPRTLPAFVSRLPAVRPPQPPTTVSFMPRRSMRAARLTCRRRPFTAANSQHPRQGAAREGSDPRPDGGELESGGDGWCEMRRGRRDGAAPRPRRASPRAGAPAPAGPASC